MRPRLIFAARAARNLLGYLRHQRKEAVLKQKSVERSRSARAPAVLEQGVAINGELRVKLFGLNLLPIQVRLLISSKDVAAAVGLDWWNDADSRARAGAPRRKATSRGIRETRRHGTTRNGRTRPA